MKLQKRQTLKKDLPFLKIANRQSTPTSKSDISQAFKIDDTYTFWQAISGI
jgi:hypothetical protein